MMGPERIGYEIYERRDNRELFCSALAGTLRALCGAADSGNLAIECHDQL